MPLLEVRCLAHELLVVFVAQEQRDHVVPHHPREIGVSTFVAHKVAGSVLGKGAVHHFDNTVDLVAVARDGTGELFVVEAAEPSSLAKVRACSACC